MDDLRATARALTRDDKGRSPGEAGFDPKKIKQYGLNWMEPVPTESENTLGFVRALGGDWYDEEYTETLIDRAPAQEQFELFRQMRCEDMSTPSPTLDLGQGDPFRAQPDGDDGRTPLDGLLPARGEGEVPLGRSRSFRRAPAGSSYPWAAAAGRSPPARRTRKAPGSSSST